MSNTINTRIQLKRDSLANWNNSDIVLKPGEIGVAYVDVATKDAQGNIIHVPTVLLKAGENVEGSSKTFSQLPFVSALAADVYSWAKETGVHIKVSGEGEVVSNIEWIEADPTSGTDDAEKVGYIKVTKTDVITPEEIAEVLKDYYTKDEVDAFLTNYYTKEELDDRFDGIVDTVTTVAQGNGVTVTSDGAADPTYTVAHADTSNVADVVAADRTYIKAIKFDDFGHVTEVETGSETVTDTNTAHTHSAGSGLTVTGEGGIDGDTKYSLNLKFADTLAAGNKLQLVDADDNTVVAEFDATNFIKDGMLENVEYDETTNTITFTWNTDGGSKVDSIELTDLLDPYTQGTDIVINGTTISHATREAKDAAAVKIGRDATGHVVIGDALTKSDVGLENVDNTSDADKPVSTKQQAAIDAALESAKKYADDNDADTTYTFADGTTDGTFKVTPKDGAEQEVKIGGLGALAYQDSIELPSNSDAAVANQYVTEVKQTDGTVTVQRKQISYNELSDTPELHTVATSGSIYDVEEGSSTDKNGIKYLIFDCGTASTVL